MNLERIDVIKFMEGVGGEILSFSNFVLLGV